MKNLLLFAGSNNSKSINHSLITAVAGLISDGSHKVISLLDYPLPLYAMELQVQGIPAEATALKEIIDAHDALVISVAEHNGSVSAFFKNTVDWLSRAGSDYRIFNNKQVVLLSASPGGGGVNAMNHAESVLTRLGATITQKIPVNNFYKRTSFTDHHLAFNDPALRDEILEAVTRIAN
ncbi:MAG TPA: NADPH-dependent FMN reductase [Chitinophaga sp.]|uniref:NADPH-dependent FMN reductase n=1 Tax=Chitinophaga sp. TaxID=1869181 RepID=UPI002C511AAB|nr:NADPH-dependent FMN reductase [Chitinophaga sp.]HVI44401.1 NADPH-dependent FMN reductase [Chitinophaga sp.]